MRKIQPNLYILKFFKYAAANQLTVAMYITSTFDESGTCKIVAKST